MEPAIEWIWVGLFMMASPVVGAYPPAEAWIFESERAYNEWLAELANDSIRLASDDVTMLCWQTTKGEPSARFFL